MDKIQTMKTQTLQRQINEINQLIQQLHLTILGKFGKRRRELSNHYIFY